MKKTTTKTKHTHTHTHPHTHTQTTSEGSKTIFRPIQNFQKKVFDSSHPGGTFISVSAVYHCMYARRSSNDEPGNNEMDTYMVKPTLNAVLFLKIMMLQAVTERMGQ